jgi:hypothetical protein
LHQSVSAAADYVRNADAPGERANRSDFGMARTRIEGIRPLHEVFHLETADCDALVAEDDQGGTFVRSPFKQHGHRQSKAHIAALERYCGTLSFFDGIWHLPDMVRAELRTSCDNP